MAMASLGFETIEPQRRSGVEDCKMSCGKRWHPLGFELLTTVSGSSLALMANHLLPPSTYILDMLLTPGHKSNHWKTSPLASMEDASCYTCDTA